MFRKTYDCYRRLISDPEDLLTALEHLLTAPEHFRNWPAALTNRSGTLTSATVDLQVFRKTYKLLRNT